MASADYIFVIEDGRLVEEGTHQELRAGSGLYSSLCARQSQYSLRNSSDIISALARV